MHQTSRFVSMVGSRKRYAVGSSGVQDLQVDASQDEEKPRLQMQMN